MKKLTKISVFILALTLSSTMVMAQNMGLGQSMMSDSTAPGAYRGMMQGQNMMGMMSRMHQNGVMGMMQGYMQNMMSQPMRRMMMSVYVLPSLNNLGLSTAQQSKLNGIKTDYIQKMQSANTFMMNFNSNLSNELNASSPDMNKMHKMIDQRTKSAADRMWLTVRTYHDMMGVLTPDQKKQFKEMPVDTFMNSMMNNMSMAQMMSMHQMMHASGQGMMNMIMNNDMTGGGMMNPMQQ